MRGLCSANTTPRTAVSAMAEVPLAAPVAFALLLAQRDNDEAMLDVAVTTLDRMGWDGLSAAVEDSDAGAFHRACARADWTKPDRAHLLDIQADMIRLYLDAWTITGADRYRDRARDTWAYVDRTLHDRANGGFFASELAGQVDRVLLTDANAQMIRTLLYAARVLDDMTLAETAARAAERIMPVGVWPRSRRRARPRHPRTRSRAASRSGARQRRGPRPRSGRRQSRLPRSLRRTDALQPPQALGRSRSASSSIAWHPPPAPATSACSATHTGRSPSTPKPRGCSNGSAVRPVTRNSAPARPTCDAGSTETIQPQGISSAEYGLVLLEISE